MARVAPEILEQIGQSILTTLKDSNAQDAQRIVQVVDYHGFIKSRIPSDFLEKVLAPFHVGLADIQIEIVQVNTDLSKEIHYHKDSFAYVVCLGHEHKTEDPKGAKVFLNGAWAPIHMGDVVQIPPGTPHGFTVAEGGVLVFMSVQSPPIEHGGDDDYHLVESTENRASR